MSENELIKKSRGGDGNSFRLLINIYRQKLFGYLWRFSDSQFHAEELFQETLIKVWKGLKKYNDKNKFSSWLFTIAHNTAVDSVRKHQKEKNVFTSNTKNFSNDGPDEDYIAMETSELITKAVKTLSEKQRNVFLLRQHSGMTFREISEITNEPLNTVISHMNYSVKKIKKILRDKNERSQQILNG